MPIKTLDEYLKQTTLSKTRQQIPQASIAKKISYKVVGFYKETEFKETPIGKIPKQWKVVKLKEIISLEYGKSLPERHRKPGNIPVVGSNGIVGYHDKALVKGPGIVVGRKGTIGAVTFIYTDFWPIDTTYYVKLKKNNIDLKWLFYQLIHLNLKRLYLADVVPGLKRELVYSLWNPLPPLEEQWGIAEVLSGVDKAIEETERLIERLERLKKALIQELLTRGIGHKEFKETPIGKIPKEWKIVRLRDITIFIKDGTHNPPRRVKSGIPLLSARNIVNGKILRFKDDTYITQEDYSKMHSKYEIQKGDVLLTIVGTIGNSAVVNVDYKFTVQRSVAIIRPNSNIIDPYYLHYAFQTSYFKRQLISCSKITTQAGVYLKELSKLKILLPPLKEQRKLANILLTIDKWIELEKKHKERFERLKKGLMNLLLTGRIRVKIDKQRASTTSSR